MTSTELHLALYRRDYVSRRSVFLYLLCEKHRAMVARMVKEAA